MDNGRDLQISTPKKDHDINTRGGQAGYAKKLRQYERN